jgi:hypothetical protein
MSITRQRAYKRYQIYNCIIVYAAKDKKQEQRDAIRENNKALRERYRAEHGR